MMISLCLSLCLCLFLSLSVSFCLSLSLSLSLSLTVEGTGDDPDARAGWQAACADGGGDGQGDTGVTPPVRLSHKSREDPKPCCPELHDLCGEAGTTNKQANKNPDKQTRNPAMTSLGEGLVHFQILQNT